MKRYLVSVLSVIFIVFLLFTLSACTHVRVGDEEIVAVFRYGEADIRETLSEEDAKTVREIFEGKNLLIDSRSCGFSKDVALVIDGNTYCIACDGCGAVFHMNSLRYFNLTDQENETLRQLLGKYGFAFPCV